jgi:hypothetical protein
MRSWKTTAGGCVSSLASLVVFMSTQGVSLPHWVVVISGFVLASGLASMGIVGKDYNVSGEQAANKDQASK